MDAFMRGLSANKTMAERFAQSKKTLQKQRLSAEMDRRARPAHLAHSAHSGRFGDREDPENSENAETTLNALPNIPRAKSVVFNHFAPKKPTSARLAMHQAIRARKVQEGRPPDYY